MPSAERGEVWQVDLGMAAKARPAVVFSSLDNPPVPPKIFFNFQVALIEDTVRSIAIGLNFRVEPAVF